MRAVGQGDEESARLLVEYGANVNAEDKRGLTPLYYSILGSGNYSESITQFLIDCGANINVKSIRGKHTMLTFATWADRLNIVKLLIELGADVNMKNKEGKTPLEVAQEHNRQDIVKFFLQDY
jgi:ankyrin repeat protein